MFNLYFKTTDEFFALISLFNDVSTFIRAILVEER